MYNNDDKRHFEERPIDLRKRFGKSGSRKIKPKRNVY